MTGAGKSHPGPMLENSALLFLLGKIVARRLVGEDNSVGDKLDEEITLRGEKLL